MEIYIDLNVHSMQIITSIRKKPLELSKKQEI
jgi:hypothetical protein